MKGLAEINAENDRAAREADARRSVYVDGYEDGLKFGRKLGREAERARWRRRIRTLGPEAAIKRLMKRSAR